MRAAVIVGCSGYEDPDVADLQFAHEDASRAAVMLQAFAGVSPADIRILRDQSQQSLLPTRANLLRGMTALGRALPQPPEILFFFFSGHGFHSSADDSDYLLLHDSVLSYPEDSSVSINFILRVLRNTGARHIVLFLDACRSAVSGGRDLGPAIPRIHVANLAAPGLVLISSCEPGKVSYESSVIGSGIFTKALCDALGEQGNSVSVQEVSHYLATAMPELTRQLGLPPQVAYTRVEPLQLQSLAIASESHRLRRRAATAVGQEIRDGGPRPASVETLPDPILAIDFGTSSSALAVTDRNNTVRYIKSSEGSMLIPSTVTFSANLDYRVGDVPSNSSASQLSHMIRHVKRYLGSERVFNIDGKDLAPELAASLIIRSLRRTAEEATGQEIRRCMTAYPANFSIRQANALLRAFQLADLEVVRMVGEPNIASALLSVERPGWNGDCLVVDLGGGTLDVAVVNFWQGGTGEHGVSQIFSVAGSNELGGVDYDDAIAALVEERIVRDYPSVAVTPYLRATIWREAQRAKHFLTAREEATLVIDDIPMADDLITIQMPLSRDDFRRATQALNAEVKRVATVAIEDAGRDSAANLVLLTGQGSKIFTVGEVLRELVPDTEFIHRYQDLAVVLGLSTYSQVLAGQNKELLILDLSHRGIGIRCTVVDGHDDSDLVEDSGPVEYHSPRLQWESPPAYFVDTVRGQWKKAPGPDSVVHVMIDRLTMIPDRRTHRVTFMGAPGDVIQLPVVERSKVAEEDIDITVIEFSAPASEVEVEITVAIDENSAVTLEVRDWRRANIYLAQINQKYRRAGALSENAILRLVAAGWKVHFRPWADAAEESTSFVYRYSGEGLSLSSFASDGKIRKLEEEISEQRILALDERLTVSRREQADIDAALRLQLLGGALGVTGQSERALSCLTAALDILVRIEYWDQAIQACDQAMDLVNEMAAENRAARLQPITASLQIMLPQIDSNTMSSGRPWADSLERIADSLLAAGAEQEAREVLAAVDRVRHGRA